MVEMKELSAFQRNMNSLTLYLYLMNARCRHLLDYDDEGGFETHNDFFNLCRAKLRNKIEGDQDLLINRDFFKSYFAANENADKKRKANKLKKEDEEVLYETYFEYSKSLPKSVFRNKSYDYVAWSLVAMFCVFLMGLGLFRSANGANSLKEHMELCVVLSCSAVCSLSYLIRGIILQFELHNRKNTKRRFGVMYSDDYCYRRIKEAEAFFRANFNVEDDILELTEIERKFPENDNYFYDTIMKTKGLSEINKKKLLAYNANPYCRAVFSELFELVKKNGVEKGCLQQIPFVFKACQIKTKLTGGNTGFSECVNFLLGKSEYTDTTFNQAMPKLENPKVDIFPKYLKILEKFENIFWGITISDD